MHQYLLWAKHLENSSVEMDCEVLAGNKLTSHTCFGKEVQQQKGLKEDSPLLSRVRLPLKYCSSVKKKDMDVLELIQKSFTRMMRGPV